MSRDEAGEIRFERKVDFWRTARRYEMLLGFEK